MAFDINDYLSVEEKAEIINQRRKAWAADLYGHMLVADAVTAAGDTVPEATTVAIASLTKALESSDAAKVAVDAGVAAKATVIEAEVEPAPK